MFAFRAAKFRARTIRAVAICSAAAIVLAVAAPAAQAATPVRFGPTTTVGGVASTDWAGWDVTGATYTSVSAAWTVPAVSCQAGETSYSADWVGLDGDGSNSVEQIGTSSDCSSGTPAYSAWYEFYPSVAVTTTNTVKAGDKMSASVVAVAGTNEFTLTLNDSTQKWTTTETASSPLGSGASAEVIAEAPSGSGRANGVLPLADFKTVTFSNVLVNGQQIGAVASPQKIAMVDAAGNPMATVTALSAADAFTVDWLSSGVTGYVSQDATSALSGQGSAGSGWPQVGSGSGYGYGSGGYGGWGYGYGYGGAGSDSWAYSGGSGNSLGYAYGYGY